MAFFAMDSSRDRFYTGGTQRVARGILKSRRKIGVQIAREILKKSTNRRILKDRRKIGVQAAVAGHDLCRVQRISKSGKIESTTPTAVC